MNFRIGRNALFEVHLGAEAEQVAPGSLFLRALHVLVVRIHHTASWFPNLENRADVRQRAAA